jgi:potassium efflux system protein
MNLRNFIYKKLLIEKTISFFFILLISFQLSAQVKYDSSFKQPDSNRVTNLNSDSVRKYFESTDTLFSYQLNKIQEYILYFNSITSKLKHGYDTTLISKGLPESDSVIVIAQRFHEGYGGQKSLKILTTTKSLLENIQKQLSGWQNDLTLYNNDLNSISAKLIVIRRDTDLFVMPEDSLLYLEYLKKIEPLKEKTAIADSMLFKQYRALGFLQNRISNNYLSVSDLLLETNSQIDNFDDKILDKECSYIWNSGSDTSFSNNFTSIVKQSLDESWTHLTYYSNANWQSRIIIFLIGILFYLWIRRNINRIKKQNEFPESILSKANQIPGHLLSSTVVFSLMMIPFFYQSSPQVFILLLWGVQIIAMGILSRKKLNMYSGIQLLILLLLFYVIGFTNLLIEPTIGERWIQLFISIVTLALSIWLLNSKKDNHFFQTPFFNPIVIAFLIMNVSALLFNIGGRVTLAKILNTGAVYGLVEAIKLFIFVEILIDAVYLAFEAGKKSSRLTAYFEFKGMESRLRKIFGIFAGFLWLVIFTQNVHIYDAIFGSISVIMSTEHKLGSLTFSLGSIAIFILVIWVSTLVSQMVSFVFGEHESGKIGEPSNKIGSTILLVRLGILTAGVLLAFGVSGIPLDKIAIVIGALGVGIGFGLQTIVNNLVSGIVLAFEKPIQIGDLIEVGTKNGIVKEIGIRSSTLTTFDGSELIIPNGDMLSQHIVNWTKDDNNRRITVSLGIAYGSDIKKVKSVIMIILNEKDEVMKFPVPLFRVINFGDNSVNLEILFWAKIVDWIELKSDVMGIIYERLNQEGIEIPYPQRDLHIRSVDEKVISGLRENGNPAKE